MVRTRQTKGDVADNPEAQEGTTAPQSNPDDSVILSVSPSPSHTGGTSPSPSANRVPGPTEGQPEDDDEFMPTTVQVAETLAAMKLRRSGDDRGHEVRHTQPNNS